jgi:hypothetical protein
LFSAVSKFQLPTQKGTEVWPQVMRPMVTVRFEGVPAGSPLAQELYAMLQGPIDGFYRKQAQNYSLSPVTMTGTRTDLGDLKMSYTNNMGTETVQVQVASRIAEEAVRRVEEKKPAPAGYYVVDLVNQSAVNVLGEWIQFTGYFSAREAGSEAPMVEDSPLDSGPTSNDVMSYCRGQTPQFAVVYDEETSGLPLRIGSLKVDLKDRVTITIELYGLAVPDEYPSDPPFDAVLWEVRGGFYDLDVPPATNNHRDGSGVWVESPESPLRDLIYAGELQTNDVPSGPGPGGAKLVGIVTIDAIGKSASFAPAI